jgi:hypothetical protein
MKPLICLEGHEPHYVPCTNRSNTKLYCSNFVNGVQSDASEPIQRQYGFLTLALHNLHALGGLGAVHNYRFLKFSVFRELVGG